MKGRMLILIVLIFLGCGKKGNTEGGILDQPKMAKVLWDIIQADEFVTTILAKDSAKNLRRERIILYDQVFKLHKISQKEFISSFKYYAGRPSTMKILFDTLSSRGELERRKSYMSLDSTAR